MTTAASPQSSFFRSLLLLVFLNGVVKPVWIFAIDRSVQNITGFADYGQYFSFYNLCIILNFLLDMGINVYVNREAAARPAQDNELFSQALYGKFMLGLLYTLAVVLIARFTGIRDWGLLLLLVLLQAGSSLLIFVRAFLTAAQRFRQDAFLSVFDKCFVICTMGSLILFPRLTGGVSIQRFVVLQVAGIGLAIVAGLVYLNRRLPGFRLMPFRGLKQEIFRASLPFALNGFLMAVILRADGFLLGRLHHDGAHEAGIYAAGFRLLDAFNMAGFLVAGFLLPFVARHWPDRAQVERVLLACRHLLMFGASWISALALAMPAPLSQLLYPGTDDRVVPVMALVLQALPAIALVHIYGTTLTATRNIRPFLLASLLFAVLSLFLNLVLIPAYGAMACAAIAVGVQFLYAAALMYLTYRGTGLGLSLPYLPAYAGAGLCTYAVTRFALHLGLGPAAGAAVSGTMMLVLFYLAAAASFRELKQLLLEK
jgi:O-antigen/teichoic acid export membrane protein